MKEQGSFNQRLEKSVGENFKISLRVNSLLFSSVGKSLATKENRELAVLKIHQTLGQKHPILAALLSNLILE
ncbi:hypothetical protein C4577_05635 [Candidatus Parcubacteria bacterium]|nr:MAG: hypothetical protein C4577_05635 [Candidatus Parcubacteria bacterium]